MAFDEALADRVRHLLATRSSVEEKRMFGGLAFMVGGHMTVGVDKASLMVRVGPERYAPLLKEPAAREMKFTGRALKGFLFIDPPGLRGSGLRKWVDRALDFTQSLPVKSPSRRPVRTAASAARATPASRRPTPTRSAAKKRRPPHQTRVSGA